MSFTGEFLGLPGLRGYWPMSAIDSSGNAIDQSGNGRTLTYNGNPTYNFHASGGPYIDLDGTGDYLSRADEAGLDIIGTENYVASAVRGLTLGGWFFRSASGGATARGLIGKENTTSTNGYILYENITGSSGDVLAFSVETIVAQGAALAATTWTFVAGRYVPSTSVDLYINGAKVTSTTASVPASIANNTQSFNIGNRNTGIGSGLFTGRAGMCFLCAMALSDTAINNIYNNTKASYGL